MISKNLPVRDALLLIKAYSCGASTLLVQAKHFNFYWLPVYLYMGLIFYLSHRPASTLPQIRFDKLLHFLEYAVLGLLLARALKKSYSQSSLLLLSFTAFFIAAVYAGTDEFHQWFIYGRNLDFYDWLADSFGAAVSSFFAFFMRTDSKKMQWPG